MLSTLLPILIVATAFMGPVFGSYFSLVVVRGSSLFRKNYGHKSECDECGHTLYWYDLVPVVSFLLLRGKCRYCGKSIQRKIFLAELMGVILYTTFSLGLWYMLATDGLPRDVFVNWAVHGTFLTILYYFAIHDMFTMSVPALQTQIAAIFAVVVNMAFVILNLINPNLLTQVEVGKLGNLVMGIVSGLFIYAIIKITKSKGMGLGDLLIAVIIGLALGWPSTVSAFYVMIFSATIFGLAAAAYKHRMKGLRIPLVPFMAFGYILAVGFGPQIFRMLFILP